MFAAVDAAVVLVVGELGIVAVVAAVGAFALSFASTGSDAKMNRRSATDIRRKAALI